MYTEAGLVQNNVKTRRNNSLSKLLHQLYTLYRLAFGAVPFSVITVRIYRIEPPACVSIKKEFFAQHAPFYDRQLLYWKKGLITINKATQYWIAFALACAHIRLFFN